MRHGIYYAIYDHTFHTLHNYTLRVGKGKDVPVLN